MSILTKAIATTFLFSGLISCGTSSSSDSGDSGPGQVDVTFDVKDTSVAFSLADPDSYTASITGCISGYSKTDITQATVGLQVQDTDVGCVFALTGMTIGAETFTPAGTENWAENQTFAITGSAGTVLYFRVLSQLDATISGAQNVSIVYATSEAGTAQSKGAEIATGVSISGGNDVNLDIVNLDVTVNGTTGAGEFDFKFHCSEAAAGSGAAATCSGVTMSTMTHGMTLDTYGATLTLAECQAVADSGGLSGTVFDQGADAGAPNGGIQTGNVTGPATLYAPANANLIVALRAPGADDGCKYFKITITAP